MADTNLSTLLKSGSVIPYDQQEIEAVMKKVLYEKGINDVLYEGSNISQLSSVISYVIGSLNVNTAVNIQETILPLATKRMNALFGARQLGYEPHQKKSYKYKLTLTPKYDESKTTIDALGKTVVDTTNTTKRSIDLIQNTAFKSGDKTYYYKGPTITGFFNFSNFDIQYKSDPLFGDGDYEDFFKEIEVVEGTLTKWEDDPTLQFIAKDYTDENGAQYVKQDYLIPFKDVEEDGIQVFIETVDYTQAPVNGVRPYSIIERTKSDQFLIDETFTHVKDKFIRQENIILGYPVIFFEYSNMGNPVNSGDNILVNVFQSSGANGAATDPFLVENTVASELFSVSSSELISVGTSEESIDSIKQNATVFNNTANRAVTKLDYIAITGRNSLVKDVEAWGGEEETPQQLGHIWISTTPNYAKDYVYTPAGVELENYELQIGDTTPGDETNLNNWYQSDTNATEIIDYLDFYKVLTMQIHHRHPLYINFDFTVDIVKYDMTKPKKTINESIFNGINNYFIDQIENFNSEYLNSNLQRILDTMLSYQSGIGYELDITGTLFKNMKDANAGDKIYCTLQFPFEEMFINTGDLEPTLLPNIDTTDFGEANAALTVDYSSFSTMNISDETQSSDILYDGAPIGTYTVNRKDSIIELVFDFAGNSLEDEVFGTDDGVYVEFNIEYPYSNGYNQNVPFVKNTIPRLRKVEFKDN